MVEISVILILIIIFTCDIFIFYCMYVFFIIMFYCVYGQMSEIKNYYYYYIIDITVKSYKHEYTTQYNTRLLV